MYTYINGDKAEYTEKKEFLYSRFAYEVIMIEGHEKGKYKWTIKNPKYNCGKRGQ